MLQPSTLAEKIRSTAKAANKRIKRHRENEFIEPPLHSEGDRTREKIEKGKPVENKRISRT